MPPRSPTRAFDPTPALDFNHNFSMFNGIHRHSSMDTAFGSNLYQKVRFEEPTNASNIHGRHSIATSHVPLLPPVPSASHLPKQSFQIMNPTPGVNISAYFEHCRNVNEQQRQAYEQERQAWAIERTALKTKIADLEFRLNKASGGRRRMSNDSPYGSGNSFKSDFHLPVIMGHHNGIKHQKFSNAPLEQLKQEHGKPVWEPESPLPATRVFSHDDDVQHLPSISEDGPATLLSPVRSNENKPIPIQEIDDTLDGITVKSEGVKSSFNKIISPIIVARSPSPKQQLPEPPRISLEASSLLDPFDAKLKKHAGHTPLAFDGELSSLGTTHGEATPQAEAPIDPAPTRRPPLRPSENSQSYFSTDDMHAPAPETILEEEELEPQFEPEDDRPLTGPLMLDASGKSQASHVFLDQLDHRLEEEVRRSLTPSPAHSPAPSQQSTKTDDENFPRLRMKKSTNFGSAYGAKAPGFFDR